MLNTTKLACRFLLRDWRSGELWLLALSLLMTVTASTVIALFSDRLQLALGQQVSEVMGADMVIKSPHPLSDDLRRMLLQYPVEHATVIEFPSVVVAGDEMQLISAKAVTETYPLRGYIRVAEQPFEPDRITSETPAPGEVWLEPRLFPLLNVAIDDSLQLGEATLTVAGAITLETDRGSSFYSLSPRLMFNIADLERTNVVQPGSRVTWKTLVAGDPEALTALSKAAQPLMSDSERLSSAVDNREDLKSSVTLMNQFLGLSSMTAMLLAGIAVAMSSRRFAQRRFDGIAVMRCMGAQQHQILGVFMGELLLIALLVAVPGMFLGWLLHVGIVHMLSGVLPAWLPEARVMSMVVGGSTGVITLAGFGLAPLLKLKDVTPLRVLRRDVMPSVAGTWLAYSSSLSAMFVLLWYYTGQFMLTVGLMVGLTCILLLIFASVQSALRRLQGVVAEKPVSLLWRLGLNRLLRERGQTSSQLIAFSMTFMAMALMLIVRTDLLERWQQQLPEDTPNYFAVNIQPHEVADFQQFLTKHAIEASDLYPIVRGRLIKINNKPARESLSEHQQQHNSLHRELNMTWSDEPPPEGQIIQGQWWQRGVDNEVSVEAEMAEELGLKPGDTLTFLIGGREREVTITSIRQVNWETFRPNFYTHFPKEALNAFPATWLNSFYLDDNRKTVLNDLVRQFPTVSLLDLDAVIRQVRIMLEQSMLAVEAMLFALLLAGLLVLAASIEASLDARLREGALIRSLGGTRKQLMMMQVGEFVLVGAVSGVVAAIGTEVCSWWLNVQVFKLPWQPVLWLWGALPATSSALVGLAGWLGVRRVFHQSPALVLKEV